MISKPSQRCAIYTRKSTEEGLNLDFNSLDAQREAAEAYIASMKHEGWVCIDKRYDDGGYTGGNMDRPALKRLLDDIKAGQIDCIVVYKVDRLSRSLLDFARLVEILDKHQVSFVSVTQHFNTTHSMGRLTLNILLSFAQFEREIISERTRDKIAAAKRKGKWSGGVPPLGYDVPPEGRKLIVNDQEATIVRAIFDLYVKTPSITQTLIQIDTLGYANKRWTTQEGIVRGGKPFTKIQLVHLLRNVLYIGKLTHKREIHNGEHPPIVDTRVFNQVQILLGRTPRPAHPYHRQRLPVLLHGLLYCGHCTCNMIHTHTLKQGITRYRYYVCQNVHKRGWHQCPSKSVPAPEIERWVIDQIRNTDAGSMSFEARRFFTRLNTRWDKLDSEAQRRILHTLISRIDYDGSQQTITIAYKQTGIETLLAETRAAEVV